MSLTCVLLLSLLAYGADEPPGRGLDRAAWRVRRHLLPEGYPDPLHSGYEKLFGQPYPAPRFFGSFRPFEDVSRLDRAFDARDAGVDWAVEGGVLTIWVPEEAAGCLEVAALESEIRLSCPRDPAASTPHRFRRPFEASVPVPARFTARGARVEREGRRVRVELRPET